MVFHAPLVDWMKFALYQIGGLASVLLLSYLLAYITFEAIEKRFRPNLYAKGSTV
jgi:hypothetical protein